jgi:hypothetical protein
MKNNLEQQNWRYSSPECFLKVEENIFYLKNSLCAKAVVLCCVVRKFLQR